jgi:histidinol phosphatase-like PHP family hydrolase
MIDLHTHTLFSDGELLPSELVRRAQVKGYTAIAVTDHVDLSNIDFVLPRLVNVCRTLNRHWNIRSIPGCEITHAPIEEIKGLVKMARRLGAKIVLVHGETISEPVIPGTNFHAIDARCDILAHPGFITEKEIRLAKSRGVALEITTRSSHLKTNKRLIDMALPIGAKLVLNTDGHREGDLVTDLQATAILRKLGLKPYQVREVFDNSRVLVKKACS